MSFRIPSAEGFTLDRGHTRPMVGLAFNLLKLFPNLHITFLSPASFLENVTKDARAFGPTSSQESRLQLVPLGRKDIDPRDFVSVVDSFIDDLSRALVSISTNWTPSGNGLDGFHKIPTLAIADVRPRSPRDIRGIYFHFL